MIGLAPKVTHIVAKRHVHGEEDPDIFIPYTNFYYCGQQSFHDRPYTETKVSEHWPVCKDCEDIKEMYT